MALNRVWIPSPNFNPRRSQNRLLVLHTAQGATDFHSLGGYFANAGAQVSAHVGIDDQLGTIGEYLRPENLAWAAFAANDWGEHAELCGFAEWSRAQWLTHPNMLKNAKHWLKEESARYGIPIVKLSADDIRAGHSGVCGHKDLTDAGAGGDHWDPGGGFPWDIVLGHSPAPAPSSHPALSGSAPAYPGRSFQVQSPMMSGDDIRQWQTQMQARGWKIATDGIYGNGSATVCRQFQAEKGYSVDGVVGPVTWHAAWTANI